MIPLPKDILAEHSVIGCVLLDNECWGRVSNLEARMFLDSGARQSFAEMVLIFADDPDSRVDSVTLAARLGGRVSASVVARYADAPGSVAMAEEYAGIVRRKFLEREALRFVTDFVEQDEVDLTGHIEAMEAHVLELKAGLSVTEGDIERHSVRNTMTPLLRELETPIDRGDLVPFPLPRIRDALGGGLVPGNVVFFAGSAKAGKTTLACQFARMVAGENKATAYFSFEQNDTDLLRTLLGQEAKVPGFVLRNRELSRGDWERVVPAANSLASLPLLLLGGRDTDPVRFWGQLDKCASKGYRVVVIDHLQLLAEVGNGDQGYAFAVKKVTRRLKLLALKHQLVLLVLSQLQERQEGNRPSIWGGSSPMQDGDAVLVYLRPSQVNPSSSSPDSVFLYLNRLPGGRRPDVPVSWDAQSNTVREIGAVYGPDDGGRYGERDE